MINNVSYFTFVYISFKINYVLYPGLESHPHHLIAKKQMKSFSGMMSVEVKGGLAGGRILAEVLY